MKIINQTKNTILAENAMLAKRFFDRIKGLLGKKDFKPGEALIIRPCNSIHTFFMHFPIDLLFIDKSSKVIGLQICFRPWGLSPIYWRAKFVIELPTGVISASQTTFGDEISLT